MRYCPNCGAEYLGHVQVCSDCNAVLADAPVEEALEPSNRSFAEDLVEIYRSGRGIDAELVRSYLESGGIDARVHGTGLGPWRFESQVTEITGIPNDFNSYRVVVAAEDAETARDLLREREGQAAQSVAVEPPSRGEWSWMALFRSRWVLVTCAAIVLMILIVGALSNVSIVSFD